MVLLFHMEIMERGIQRDLDLSSEPSLFSRMYLIWKVFNIISFRSVYYVMLVMKFPLTRDREGNVVDQKNVTLLTANRQNNIYGLDTFSAENSLHHCFFSRAQSHLYCLWTRGYHIWTSRTFWRLQGISL